MQQLSAERAKRNTDQLSLQETVIELKQSLQSEHQASDGEVPVLGTFSCLVHVP